MWGDFHARSRFARSAIPEEKCGTTCSLHLKKVQERVTVMRDKQQSEAPRFSVDRLSGVKVIDVLVCSNSSVREVRMRADSGRVFRLFQSLAIRLK